MNAAARFLLPIVFCFAAIAATESSRAQAPAKVEPVAEKSFDPKYLSTPNGAATFLDPQVSCYSCHQATDPNQAEMYRERGTLKRVTLVETARWRELDFHTQAAQALTTPRAKAMGELLGYDVAKSTQCLNCHSGHQKITAQTDRPPQLAAPREALVKHGVSCQACHGPAEKWWTAHTGAAEADADWWKKSSDEKHKLGLLDVRHPVTRAQVCLSCHLGSSSEGKILTHDMYAAGHPPLQNFEVEAFVAGMPYHGVLIEEKTKSEPTAHQDWHKAGDFYRTRSALTGGIVALRMQVQLMLDETAWLNAANEDAAKRGAAAAPAEVLGERHRPRWPELAHFNCASCHHELAADRAVPDRAGVGAPGRPMLRTWPTVLYEVAMVGSGLETAAGEPSGDAILKPLENALGANPFGSQHTGHAQVRRAAQIVADRLDRELAAFEARTIDRSAALKYLDAICAVGLSRPIEYEEARQLAWGATAIVAELKNAAATEAEKNQAARLETAVSDFDALGEEGAALKARLDEELRELSDDTTLKLEDKRRQMEMFIAERDRRLELVSQKNPSRLDLRLKFPRKPSAGGKVSDPKSYYPNLLEAGHRSLSAAFSFDESAFRRRLENLKSALAPKS